MSTADSESLLNLAGRIARIGAAGNGGKDHDRRDLGLGLHTEKIWRNEGMRRLFGFPPEELEPKSDSSTSRIHPDDSEAVQGVA